MAKHNQPARTQTGITEVALRLFALQSSEVQESLQKLRERYGAYAASSEEVRVMLDKALGDRSLTDELYKLRES